MAIFSKRPLFTACMLFMSFCVINYFVSSSVKLAIGAISLMALIFTGILVICKKAVNYSSLCVILCCGAILVSSISSYLFFNVRAESYKQYYGQEHTINATVIDENYDGGNLCGYRIKVNTIDGKADPHLADLNCFYNSAIEIGDNIIMLVTAEGFTDETYGRYNEKISKISDEVFIIYTSKDEDASMITEQSSINLNAFFSKLNSGLSRILTSNIGGENGRLASAILLGNRELLSNITVRDFSRAGVSHILAISGMHMSILMGALMMLLKKMRIKHSVIAVILSAFALFYLALTGFSVSATRSVIMLLIVYLSMLFGSVADSLTSLSLAGVIIMLISPGAILDAGFWMSFSATLGILAYLPAFNKFIEKLTIPIKKHKKLVRGLAVVTSTVAAGIFAIIPLIIVMCIFIKEMSWFSVISSAILSVPTSLIIILSLVFIPFSSVPYISGFIASLITAVSNFMLSHCAEVSKLENVVFSLNYSFAYVFAIIIGLCLACSLIFKSRNIFISLTPFIIAVAIFFGTASIYEISMGEKVKITYLNCSTKADMLVMSNNREVIICDIANGSNSSFNKALDAVYEARATEIKSVMLTRYANSYPSALYNLFSSNIVRELWLPYPRNESEYYKMIPIINVANELGVAVKVYDDTTDLTAFTYVKIEATGDRIARSTELISLISIHSRSDRFTYASPAFNESNLAKTAEKLFSRSDYIIFGNRGPKTKTKYSIPENSRVEMIAFADNTRVAYFEGSDELTATYFLVPERIDVYIDK